MTGQKMRSVRLAAGTFAVIAAAVLCRRVVLVTDNGYIEQLANLVGILLYIGLFAVWGISVFRRVIQLQVRGLLVIVAALMISWLAVRELRWHMVYSPDVKRFLWYVYYIPMLVIPLLALMVSLSLGKPEAYRLPRAAALLYIPTAMLIIMVLTNDFTRFVFAFPEGRPWSESSYTYGPGFYIVSLWALLCAAAAFGVMLSKCRLPRNGRFLWLPLLPFGITVAYVLLYALRVPVVVDALGDVAVTECLLFTAFFESCIASGLIASNSRYADLFRASTSLAVRITDRDYNIRYSARDAEPVSQEKMREAENAPVILENGRRLHNLNIRGGHAVWTEDISELVAARESLAETREELIERDGLLQTEYREESEYRRVMEQNRLYDLMQRETQSQLDAVSRLTSDYEKTESEAEKRRILGKIVILGSYIKRRKDLVLLMEGVGEIPESRLSGALEESFRALRLGGIRGGYLVETGRGSLGGDTLTLAYDFFESVLESVLDEVRYIIVYVNAPEGTLACRVITDCAGEPEALARRFPRLSFALNDDGGAVWSLPLEGGGEA